MENMTTPTQRRGFLQTMLVFLGGGLGVAASTAPASTEPPVPPGTRLRFYAKSHTLAPSLPGQAAPVQDRRNRRATLLTHPDGEAVGEYYAASLCQPGAFGVQLAESPQVELQTFRLAGGTLFGAGANEPTAKGGTMHALLGGTGRFAGLRGTFHLTPFQSEASGEEWMEIEINLMS